MFGKIKRYARNHYYALGYDLIVKHPHWMSDKFYLTILFKMKMGYELNWRNPKSFCEKVNWLKLHDRNPLYHQLVDKYEVKQWVTEKIGEEHVVKNYGLYNSVDEIDYNKLPNRFVLKCTHDSGSYVVCQDKATFDKEKARAILANGLNAGDFSDMQREWAYRGVQPRIIAEEYIDTLGKPDSIEYKITCFNGKVRMFTICSGIPHSDFDKRFNDHYDREGNRLPFFVYYKPAGLELPKKPIYEEMVRIAETLSAGIPQVRVDLYEHEGKIMFGEMTFYTWGGMMEFTPKEWDFKLGEMLELPHK